MGLLSTRWEGEYEGRAIVVSRNEIGRGFQIEWDAEVIASRSWSFLGLGELQGTASIGDRPVEVKVTLSWGGFSEMDGKCTVTIDGKELLMKHTK
jgi:hypothetical protein